MITNPNPENKPLNEQEKSYVRNTIIASITARGVAAADAEKMAERVSFGQNGFPVIENMPLDQFLQKLTAEKPLEGSQKIDPQKFDVESAMKDPSIYQAWLEKDPEGLQKAFDEYHRSLVPQR